MDRLEALLEVLLSDCLAAKTVASWDRVLMGIRINDNLVTLLLLLRVFLVVLSVVRTAKVDCRKGEILGVDS